MSIVIALALGGNAGDVRINFENAVAALGAAGIRDIMMSSVRVTAPVDCPPGSPDFFNAALTGLCDISPLELLDLCKRLEHAAGRALNYPRNSPRPLDIDIILYGDLIYSDERLTVPHPRAAEREFVLGPLAEIAPELVFPDSGLSVGELLGRLKKSFTRMD
jgi:2-amino-4-hydroxy-6-hydroxymethyldihydropteridine diphosphokinase